MRLKWKHHTAVNSSETFSLKTHNPRIHIPFGRSIKVVRNNRRPICDALAVMWGDRLGRLVYFNGFIVMRRRRHRTLSSIILVVISSTKDVLGRKPRTYETALS